MEGKIIAIKKEQTSSKVYRYAVKRVFTESTVLKKFDTLI
jgi:rubrerythrin